MNAGSEPPSDAIHEHVLASIRLEEACDFAGAALEALLAEDPRRAARLAAFGGDDALALHAVDRIVASLSAEEARIAAADLAARGFGAYAGLIFDRMAAPIDAGEAYAAGGDVIRAAASYERGGRPEAGARALEAALRARPGDEPSRLALGRLLARHGRTEAAVKTLQRIAPASPERALALPLLRRSLLDLGLDEAARTLAAEMDRLGVTDEAPPSAGAAQPSAGAAEGPVILGRYAVLREVATTPHARVLEAVDRLSNDRVAVKLFAGVQEDAGRDALLRFEREARALAQLRHPNVVPLRDYHPEGPAIVLAWMPGGSLADRLRGPAGEATVAGSSGPDPIAPARAVEIVGAVLGALGEAHRVGILHRDVKPSNVLFDEFGTARLSDFGAAHLGDLSTTATAGAIGTFAYMSPEQRVGRAATLQSDVYAAGVLLCEMLTDEAQGPVDDRRGGLPRPPSACHPDLGPAHDAVLERLLQNDPKRRPADAFEARRALQSLRWPDLAVPRAARRSGRAPSLPPRAMSGRLVPCSPTDRAPSEPMLADASDAVSRWRDTWLERDVLLVPFGEPDDVAFARARAFALADHPTLASVLRVDAEARAIWVSPPRGQALADAPRRLLPEQLARLVEAIEALHAAQGAHGRIDPEHLYWHDGEISLAWPRAIVPVVEAAALDRAALERLADRTSTTR